MTRIYWINRFTKEGLIKNFEIFYRQVGKSGPIGHLPMMEFYLQFSQDRSPVSVDIDIDSNHSV